ncbi:TetR/AcrR family transcriptional regulator [Leucobacter chromiireducens subsp. chromiireducens]|uniref:TetR/AcrR family transcriptional regulator n=1 Tax=Leucobacter chromiireducens subsp. chromiireducens TaxID=660067 RepID=A0ABS1SN35_9MICO|nr:TetR/AcrR family transcriptional regulator [Leucobacter chromiireducens subsp. chromiireducens]
MGRVNLPESDPAEAGPLRGRAREARSNDESILRAAREVFSEWGWGAPMSEIAARAGAGVASIYRRYPSKVELVNAIRVLSLEEICALAEASAQLGGADPAAASPDVSARPSVVGVFLRRQVIEAPGSRMPTFGQHVGTTPEIDRLSDRLHAALSELVRIDRDRGVIPADFGPADVMLTITHLRPVYAVPRERANELHLRHLDFVLAGLRARAAGQRVPGAADPAELGAPTSWAEWLRLNNDDDREQPRG